MKALKPAAEPSRGGQRTLSRLPEMSAVSASETTPARSGLDNRLSCPPPPELNNPMPAKKVTPPAKEAPKMAHVVVKNQKLTSVHERPAHNWLDEPGESLADIQERLMNEGSMNPSDHSGLGHNASLGAVFNAREMKRRKHRS